MKTCPRCKAAKPIDRFGKDPSKRDGRQSHCRDCCNAARRARYMAKIEHERARGIAYYADNSERVKARKQADRARAIEIYGGKCEKCASIDRLEFDHIEWDGVEHRAVEHHNAMIRRIVRTGARIADRRLRLLCFDCHRRRSRQRDAARIAERRLTVLRLRADGWTREQIGAALGISVDMVRRDNAANRQLAKRLGLDLPVWQAGMFARTSYARVFSRAS